MVEIKPSSLKLEECLSRQKGTPSSDLFEARMEDMPYRCVDLIARGSPDGVQWINGKDVAVFEIRSPDLVDLAALVVIVARLRPIRVDYMHADGEHCIVYMLKW
jgi:hypothetical protein